MPLNAVNYDGPDESMKCAYPGCANRLRRSDFNEPQFCSKEHRDAAATPLAATLHPCPSCNGRGFWKRGGTELQCPRCVGTGKA